jgi:hypothetical protein
LADLNAELAEKVKDYEGKISSLTSTVVRLRGQVEELDSLLTQVEDLTPPDDTTGVLTKAFTWQYEKSFDDKNYRKIAGRTVFTIDTTTSIFQPLKTSITTDIIRFEITQGLRTRPDGTVEMFATSSYPNFEVEELNSVLISPETHPALKQFSERKKFGLGIYAGFGGTVNLSTSTMVFGPQIGFGASWKIW